MEIQREGRDEEIAGILREEKSLEQTLRDLFAAIRRLKAYTDGCGRQGLEESMRRDAVSHNFGLIAHGMLELQDISGFQKYEAVLNRWLNFLWGFTWKAPESIDWDTLWHVIEQDVPQLKADLLEIEAAERH